MTRAGVLRSRSSAGQAAVEAVAAFPLVVVAALLCLQAMAVGAVAVQADNAAHAAAVAYGEAGADSAERAARRAVPGWTRGRVSVSIGGGFARVTMRPRALFPGIAPALSARAPLPLAGGE